MEIFFKWEADIASYYQYNRNIISSAREQSFKNKLPACRHITIAKFFKVYVSFVQQNGGICQPLLLLVFVLLLVLQEVTADSFLSHPLIYPTCPLFKCLFPHPQFFIPLPFKIFDTVSLSPNPCQSIHQPHPTYQPPLQWRYLFPATNHKYLNSDDINQNLIHLLFFSFCYTIGLTTFVA